MEKIEIKSNFQFELGEIVRLKGSYRDVFIKARGMFEYLDGHVETTYLGNLDGERPVFANEYELSKIEKKK